MSFIKRMIVATSFLFISVCALAASSNQQHFVEGKDYQLVTKAPAEPQGRELKVIEFFSYGCPGCYHFEPYLEAWLKNKPKGVVFERVPVVFHQGWDVYARAFYVASSMNVLDKIQQPLFDAIHKQNQPLADEQAMAEFFAKQGINKQEFINRYEFMPLIGAQLEKSDKLVKAYGIYEVPTLIIGDKYRTNIAMVNGDVKRLFAVVDYLIAKAR